jgi:hypothetical protein
LRFGAGQLQMYWLYLYSNSVISGGDLPREIEAQVSGYKPCRTVKTQSSNHTLIGMSSFFMTDGLLFVKHGVT